MNSSNFPLAFTIIKSGVCVCGWAQIYYLMETCVCFTPPSGDMIPYGNIIQCSIREKNQETVCENAET